MFNDKYDVVQSQKLQEAKKKRVSRTFAEKRIAAKGCVQNSEETQDQLRVRQLREKEQMKKERGNIETTYKIEADRLRIGEGGRLRKQIQLKEPSEYEEVSNVIISEAKGAIFDTG